MSHIDDGPAEYEFPVSAEQARLLVLDRMHPGSTQYHVPAAFAVHGPFELDAFRAALVALIARHESLRTVFRADGDGYRQLITDQAEPPLTIQRYLTPEQAPATLLAAAGQPFDVGTGPLLRCSVLALTDGSHRILLTAHHIVCDGWSLQIVLRELATTYRAVVQGRPEELEPLPIQYPDYAAWQQEQLTAGAADTAVEHWRDLLRGAPERLEPPTDRPRPAVQSTAASAARFVLPAAQRHRLATLAGSCAATPFMVLFAAYTAFLSRISGQQDLVVGVPVSGRDRAEVQGMVGMLTNTLALRTDLSGAPTGAELVGRVRDMVHAGRQHQHAPFSAVVDALAPRRQLSHDPVVQVAFAYDDDTELRLDLAECRVDRVELALEAAKFDLLLYVERQGPDLAARLIHRSDLYEEATVRRWADSFQVLLGGLLDEPHRPVTQLPLLDATERDRLLRQGTGPAVRAPSRLIPDLVADQAATRPEGVALVHGDTVLSYRELLERADRIAERLRTVGVGPDVPVGVCLPRGVEMAVAALAVVRAGGAYLPLDPAQPVARLNYLLTAARARLVLTAGPTELGVPAAVVAPGAVSLTLPGGLATRPATRVPAGSRDLGYLLYTSGSTGTPKGVAVEHRALANLATAVRAQFPVTGRDRVLQYVSFGFDVAVSDLFFAWTAGAELHIAGEHERLGEALYDRLRDSAITYAFLPPAAAMSLPCPPGALPALRTLAIGGEPCPAELVERWATAGRRLIDAYGPSECSVYATLAALHPGEPVRIGRPVANSRAYVLDARLEPVPVGVTGELYLTGAGLARGYAGQPGMTAERFVADPFGPPGARLYRTGDLARYDDDGVLSYLGRTDSQVKVRGFRVELGEVETVLAGHPQVREAAATVLGAGADRRLVAYVVATPGATPAAAALRTWLSARLPGYLVPDTVVALDALPLGPSGKLDRARLPEPPGERPELDQPYLAPTSVTERQLTAIWSRVLGLPRIGVHDNFFELGGNSIRLLAVLTALREQRSGVDLVELFRYPTIAALATHLDRPAARPADTDPTRRGQDRRERLTARRAQTRTRTISAKGDRT